MTDADHGQWRAAGLKAGELYGEDLATLVQGKSVGDAQVQNLIELLGVNLQGKAKRLREMEIPEELIEEYTRAAVESVMLRMHALHTATDGEAESRR
ncbi:hypothetical protein [Methylobacterium goesingense]|uniref:Uncharacterized protein n=1 Tax=Methylobacterium goesingense TaxID=243690 RepID=A0ABV2L9S6_9HYPH|nr:hypothetical protein [Methylobacterium goesingense]GJD74114.1 hypothetical protein CFIICLFH_2347 [Methylobacterium goesingense]